jgi:HTH-type transcriptional regulator, competence development regulator
MKIEIPKDWCLRMASLEADAEIGVGVIATDPFFDGEAEAQDVEEDEPSIAFGRFVRLMRRDKGLTLEELAEETDIDIAELVEIEDDVRHKAELRTVYQLANYFRVPRGNLMQVAGLTTPKNDNLIQEAVRFAARSEPVAALNQTERAALEAFVSILSEQD